MVIYRNLIHTTNNGLWSPVCETLHKVIFLVNICCLTSHCQGKGFRGGIWRKQEKSYPGDLGLASRYRSTMNFNTLCAKYCGSDLAQKLYTTTSMYDYFLHTRKFTLLDLVPNVSYFQPSTIWRWSFLTWWWSLSKIRPQYTHSFINQAYVR